MKPTPSIIISCEPRATVSFASKFSAIVNVADSPCQLFTADVPVFWFPVQETGRWGYAPFYGTAKVLDHLAEFGLSKPVLVHCHGGVNRSPTIVYAVLASNGMSEEWFDQHFPIYGKGGMRAIYEENVARGCVEPDTIEFLEARHQHPDSSIVGLLKECGSLNIFHPGFKVVT